MNRGLASFTLYLHGSYMGGLLTLERAGVALHVVAVDRSLCAAAHGASRQSWGRHAICNYGRSRVRVVSDDDFETVSPQLMSCAIS